MKYDKDNQKSLQTKILAENTDFVAFRRGDTTFMISIPNAYKAIIDSLFVKTARKG